MRKLFGVMIIIVLMIGLVLLFIGVMQKVEEIQKSDEIIAELEDKSSKNYTSEVVGISNEYITLGNGHKMPIEEMVNVRPNDILTYKYGDEYGYTVTVILFKEIGKTGKKVFNNVELIGVSEGN